MSITDLTPQQLYMIFGLISLVAGFVLIYYYVKSKQLLNEMWAVDTYDARELRRMCSDGFDATVEVEGEVMCEHPLTSLASQFPCCWFRTTVETKKRHVRYTKSGAQTYYEWETDYDKAFGTIFKVQDSTGYTLVDPMNADIETERACQWTVCEREPWFENVRWSDTGEYRITEEIFVPAGYAYILGQASCTQKGTNPDALIHYPSRGYMDEKRRFFVISRKNEKELTQSKELTLKICIFFSVPAFLAAGYCFLILGGVIPSDIALSGWNELYQQ